MLPDLTPLQWTVAAVAAVSIGIAKTGVPGFGIFAVPLFALLVGDAVGSAGWLLPLLIVADLFAVAYHRRHAQVGRLVELIPWVLVGMVLGGAFMMAERAWIHGGPWARTGNIAIGGMILVMVLLHVWRRYVARIEPKGGLLQVGGLGTAAGFTTVVANAAGPVMNLYFLAKRFPKEQLIGTGAWFFLVVNTAKVPFYALGPVTLFSWQSLAFDAVLVPGVIIGALVGKRIFVICSERVFEILVLALAGLASLVLVVKAPKADAVAAPVIPAATAPAPAP